MDKMKINTYQFGEVEFNENRIIFFDSGLIGFEQLKKYLLIKTEDELFYWLNSVEQPEIAFPLIGLRLIDESFPQEKDNEAFGIVTLNSDPLKITINMKAPVFINQDKKTGFQKILEEEKFEVYYKLFIE